MNRVTDEVLVQQTISGDTTAFEQLVERYQKQIYSLAYRLTNDAEDALDLSQEVFLKLYQVLDKFDSNYKFFSWMYKIATNVCYTKLRKKNSEEAVSLDKVIDFTPLVPPNEDQQPESYSERRELERLVQQAIAELPDKYRIPLVLRYLEEMTYQQIAETLELPLTTIETRLYRGKSLMRKRLSIFLERGERDALSRS